jgi:hypothetical protein
MNIGSGGHQVRLPELLGFDIHNGQFTSTARSGIQIKDIGSLHGNRYTPISGRSVPQVDFLELRFDLEWRSMRS